VSALLAISADEDDDANGAVNPQDGYRRGPQGNIVIDEPVKLKSTLDREGRTHFPAPGRPLAR